MTIVQSNLTADSNRKKSVEQKNHTLRFNSNRVLNNLSAFHLGHRLAK